MVIPPYVRLLLVTCIDILIMQHRRFPVSFWRGVRCGDFHHTPGNLLDGCLIGFVAIVCCTVQHITTYKIAIIPRNSSAGGLCRGSWLQCCGSAVRLRLCAFVSCWWWNYLTYIARVLPDELSHYGATRSRDFTLYENLQGKSVSVLLFVNIMFYLILFKKETTRQPVILPFLWVFVSYPDFKDAVLLSALIPPLSPLTLCSCNAGDFPDCFTSWVCKPLALTACYFSTHRPNDKTSVTFPLPFG
ncbi:hypothetical protein INA60_002672 [Salmonella enterica]|nr:hypothetical protein [Salmonella enterica]